MNKTGAIFAIAVLLLSCERADFDSYVDFDTFLPYEIDDKPVLDQDGELNPEILMPEDLDARSASRVSSSVALKLMGAITDRSLVHVAGTYTGRDIDGSPLTLSGKIIFPRRGRIKNMIIVSHYTICADYECPSESFPMEAILATKGYALVMADYIGYGVTANRIHPYMHIPSTARSVVDFALAAKPYLEKIGRKPESDDVILVGYSQGGAVTMGVMDMIQDEYSDELPIRKVYAGGGPYDLAATFDISMEEDMTGIPCAIPMIVQGVNEGNALGLEMKDFFQPDLLENYQEWINSKKYTVGEVCDLMGASALHELMTDEGRDKTSPKTALLYKALMLNSTLKFLPEAPVMLFHSTKDNTVPFENARRAEKAYKTLNVQFDFGDYGSHAMGAVVFIGRVLDEL